MIHSENKKLEIQSLLDAVWRKKWLILICIVCVLTPIIIYNQISTPVYEASTSLIYEHYDDAMNTSKTFRPLDKSMINNELEEIKSLSMAEDVVEALSDEIIQTFQMPSKKSKNFNREAYLCKLVNKSITAENIVSSDVVVITTRANNPNTGMVLAQTVTEVLKKRNLESRFESISNVRQLIEDQLVKYHQQLQESEEALRNYKEKGEITYIDEESREILRRITEAEVLYNNARANRDAAEKRLSYFHAKLTEEREGLLPSITENTSPMVKRLKDELIELQIQYTKIKVRNYEEDHPIMLELKSQINQTKEKLIDETLKLAKGDNIIDPLSQMQRSMEEIINIEVEVQANRAQEMALMQILDEYKDILSTMPEKELILARLIRDREVNNKIYTMLMEKREEARIREAEKFGNWRVFDPPKMPQEPVWPKKFLNILLGVFLGFIIGLGWILFIESVDDRLKTVEQLKDVSQLNMIGIIPKLKRGVNAPAKATGFLRLKSTNAALAGKLISYHKPKSMEIEVFRALRTNLQFSGLGKKTKSILLTSCYPGEGKTLITANLGIAVASIGMKTLLIDADLRKPTLHAIFDLDRKPGLSNIIFSNHLTADVAANDQDLMQYSHEELAFQQTAAINENEAANKEVLKDYISKKNLIHHTQTAGLDLLPSGAIPPNPADVLALPILRTIISIFEDHYDVVLIDSPPINVVIDAGLLSSHVDGVLLVAKSGINTQTSILRAKEMLTKTSSNLLGIVANVVDGEFEHTDYYSNNGHI
ncbi:AAA family ATPase [candidate division KSB1 bacterium]|nr:AAA family ATPase [candidate division KSB1 bacterium]